MKRVVWVTGFLLVTLAAVGLELWAALDHDKNTVPWTELITRYVPAWIYMPAALLLAVWLPYHLWSNRKKVKS